MNYLDYKRVYTLKEILDAGNEGTKPILLADGSSSAPAYGFASEPTRTGMWAYYNSTTGYSVLHISALTTTTGYGGISLDSITNIESAPLSLSRSTIRGMSLYVKDCNRIALRNRVDNSNHILAIIDHDILYDDLSTTLMTDPTLRLYSHNTSTTLVNEYLQFYHDGTDGIISTGKGSIKLSGGQKIKRTAVSSATYTITKNDYLIGCDTTSNAITLTLPSAEEGLTFVIKDEGGNASSNNITITTPGSETIDGNTSIKIISNYNSVELYSDGNNWFIK